jgi:hypothetical protein
LPVGIVSGLVVAAAVVLGVLAIAASSLIGL